MKLAHQFRTLGIPSLVVALVVAFLAAGPAAAAAQSTASLQGTVTDTQTAVMPGVSITVRNVATGIERSVVTDSAGHLQNVIVYLENAPGSAPAASTPLALDQRAVIVGGDGAL